MPLSMSQASQPVILRGLTNLSNLLKKAEANLAERKIDSAILVTSRLAPDMFPLAKQIQIATDVTKGGIARLAGESIPSYADDETTFEQLQARLAKTIEFIKSIPAAKLDNTEEKEINLKVGGNELTFTGQDYLFGFVLPNLYFHTSIAHAILRHNGVPLGKLDYLGAPKQ